MTDARRHTTTDASWPLLLRPPGLDDGSAENTALAIRRGIGADAAARFGEAEFQRLLNWGGFDVAVTTELSSDVGGAEAMLVPVEGNRFYILVDPRPHGGWRPMSESEQRLLERRRIRFRIAHEVAHALFYERCHGSRPKRNASTGSVEEQFCDRFAAALLLPPVVVQATPLTAEGLFGLTERFDVSAQVAARSISTYHPDVSSVSLIVESQFGPRIQWSSDAEAAKAAVAELLGRQGAPRERVEWSQRGRQRLRLERLAAAT